MAEHGIASSSPDAIPGLQAVDGAYGHSTLTAFCNASLSKIGRLCRVVLSFEVECNPAGRPIYCDAGDLAVHCSLRLLDRQNHRLIWASLNSICFTPTSRVLLPALRIRKSLASYRSEENVTQGNAGELCSFLTKRLLSGRSIMRTALMLAMTMSLLATACSKDTQLNSIARELETTVNRCVIDVRDKTSKYDTSPNCRALSEIAKRYIAAGGLKQSAPCVADRIAEGAHAKAWMALAISKTGDPNLVIW